MRLALPSGARGEQVLRGWLLTSAIISITLGLLHHADHLLRGNHIGWPFSPHVTPFTFSLAVYPLYLAGIYWTARGRLWTGYWLAATFIYPGPTPSPTAEPPPQPAG